jgi:hypothetical protein
MRRKLEHKNTPWQRKALAAWIDGKKGSLPARAASKAKFGNTLTNRSPTAGDPQL